MAQSKTSMHHLLEKLPVMPESILPAAQIPGPGWWKKPQNLAPAVIRPQLNQELSELVKYAQYENIVLVPVGGGSLRFVGDTTPTPRPALLVQPGWTTVWSGPDITDQTAWMPSGMSIDDAEKALNEQGYTLSLWPEDFGSLGGNWLVPRGSFAARDFLSANNRRLGVEAIMAPGEWMVSVEAPRSASGPNIARFLASTGGQGGLITRVRMQIRKLRSVQTLQADFADLETLLKSVRELIIQDFRPTALTVIRDDVASASGRLVWRQSISSDWDALSLEAARRQFKLVEVVTTTPQVPQQETAIPRQHQWRDLLNHATTQSGRKKIPTILAGPTMQGMVSFHQDVPQLPATLQTWLTLASDRTSLAQS